MPDSNFDCIQNGLVSFYGYTNATATTGKFWKAPEAEKIKKCFKFVRAPRVSMQEADTIVA